MGLREDIINANLSCNIERVALWLLDNDNNSYYGTELPVDLSVYNDLDWFIVNDTGIEGGANPTFYVFLNGSFRNIFNSLILHSGEVETPNTSDWLVGDMYLQKWADGKDKALYIWDGITLRLIVDYNKEFKLDLRQKTLHVATYPNAIDYQFIFYINVNFGDSHVGQMEFLVSSRGDQYIDLVKMDPINELDIVRVRMMIYDNGDGTQSIYLQGGLTERDNIDFVVKQNTENVQINIYSVGGNTFIPNGVELDNSDGKIASYLETFLKVAVGLLADVTGDNTYNKDIVRKSNGSLGISDRIIQIPYDENDFDYLLNADVNYFEIDIIKTGDFASVNGIVRTNSATTPGTRLFTMPSGLKPLFFDGVYDNEPFASITATHIASNGDFSANNADTDKFIRFNFNYRTN